MKKTLLIGALIALCSFSSFAADENVPTPNQKEIIVKQNNNSISTSVEKKADKKELSDKEKYAWPKDAKEIEYSEFIKALDKNLIDTVMFSLANEDTFVAHLYFKDKSHAKVILPGRTYTVDMLNKDGKAKIKVVNDFNTYVKDAKITDSGGILSQALDTFLEFFKFAILIAILGLVLVFIQIYGMRLFSNPGKKVKPKHIDVTFDDIAGIDEAKKDVKEVVDFLNNKKNFNKFGAKIPGGILLSGDPGNGKTMLAKAVAKECNADFYQISGAELVEVYVGLGAARVRGLFKKARRSKKAVIFIDEIDAIGGKRGQGMGRSEHDQTLNQLLIEMDGFNKHLKHDLIIIAATNMAESLDEALLRPGRFDRQIIVNKPNLKGREDILNVYLKKALLHQEKSINVSEKERLNINALAKLTPGFSGAELANIVNEALILAAKRNASSINQYHLLEARDKMLLGEARHDMDLLLEERRTTAYHETGHVVAALLHTNEPVEKVTITPRGKALGLMLQVPTREPVSINLTELKGKVRVLMAGRAAEELYLSEVTTGAANDMERAFEIALNMFTIWGMGNTLKTSSISPKLFEKLSDTTRAKVEQEAINFVSNCYEEVKTSLTVHHKTITEMVELLLEKETLDKKEIVEIWKKYNAIYPDWYNKEIEEKTKERLVEKGDIMHN